MSISGKAYVDETVNLSTLLDEGCLTGYTLHRCHLIGPLVLWFREEVIFGENGFDAASEDMVRWPIAAGRSGIIGAVPVSHCRITQCRLTMIGIAIAEDGPSIAG